jgi:RHS repeat-associated protein
VATYGYSTRNELTNLTFMQGSTTLGTLTYTYDAAGRRATVGGTWARTGLPAAVASATYDDANRQLTWGGQTLTYDDNGNLTGDGTNTYSWDARNRLATISGGTVASFQYDPLGRRTRKTIAGQTTDFLYDGDNPVQELSGGTVLANLLTGLGIDEYFTQTDGSGRRTLLGDALGSILALTDDAGVVQTAYTYEPFGQVTVTGQGNTNPFQFTGRENDGTGLYYYRARYYSPGRQHFVAEDPIGFSAGDANLYAYVGNEPISSTDPLGLYVYSPQGAPLLSGTMALSGRKTIIVQGTVVQGIGAAPAVVVIAGVSFLSAAVFKVYQDWYFERGIFAKDPRKQAKRDAEDPMGDNARENKMARDAANQAGLRGEAARRELHDAVTGRNLTYDEILREAREIAQRENRRRR